MRRLLIIAFLLITCTVVGEGSTNKNADSTEAKALLRFLYDYMPLADATDYPMEYHLGNVEASLKSRSEMPWGSTVPDMLFRHFVLPMRVNNEPLDSSRIVFYKALKSRVRNLSMKDAILEVNHWCHEHVTYEPSDARTSSPLQTMRTAKGRCGEESTFLVTALRSVCIPARQVYTPRWAHTDDNHAWVEAWADGKWWFLGACEPEPVLNLGWFNVPASRVMLTHTRVFGDYHGPEEVVMRTKGFTEINLTSNYAPVSRTEITVVDKSGKPVDGAYVEFKIYNYAEYYSAVAKYTDSDGRTFLSAGLGDMVVWASKNGYYGYKKVSFGKDKSVKIVLSNTSDTLLPGEDMDIVPPGEHANIPMVTATQRSENNRRIAYEDSLRNAYTATFPTTEFLKDYKYPSAVPFLVKSRGNWKTIKAFIERHNCSQEALNLLSSLSDKDLRDMPTDILEDNIGLSGSVLCPRVEDEFISRPFKHYFATKAFSKQAKCSFRQDPTKLVKWVCDSIQLLTDEDAQRIPQTPMSVWQCRKADARSRDIFFVDIARSLGIQARKDPVTGKVQYTIQPSTDGKLADGKWTDVDLGEPKKTPEPQGRLVLSFKPTSAISNPKYYNHFTLSRIQNGVAQLLAFDEGDNESEGATWENTFRSGIDLDCGIYLLVSGQRMADGSVLAHNTFFRIQPGSTTTVKLIMRDDSTGVSVIGSFDSESKFEKDGKRVSLLSTTGRGYYILGIISPGEEPSDHALRDIAKVREQLSAWGRPMVLLFESNKELAKFHPTVYGGLPVGTMTGIDDGSILGQITKNMKLKSASQLPVFIIADTFNRVVFVSQGYTIGLGERLKTIADRL